MDKHLHKMNFLKTIVVIVGLTLVIYGLFFLTCGKAIVTYIESEKRMEVIEKYSIYPNETVVYNGYSITMESYMYDPGKGYCVFSVTGLNENKDVKHFGENDGLMFMLNDSGTRSLEQRMKGNKKYFYLSFCEAGNSQEKEQVYLYNCLNDSIIGTFHLVSSSIPAKKCIINDYQTILVTPLEIKVDNMRPIYEFALKLKNGKVLEVYKGNINPEYVTALETEYEKNNSILGRFEFSKVFQIDDLSSIILNEKEYSMVP